MNIIRRIQLEIGLIFTNSIYGVNFTSHISEKELEMGKVRQNKYDIQELIQRDVYVKDKKVGVIVGERHHPNELRVQSLRLMVEPTVAEEFMRKPADFAPLSKELVHSIQAKWIGKVKQIDERAPKTMEEYCKD